MKDDEIPQAGEPARTPLRSQRSPPQRILVVDDEISMLLLSTEVLIQSGYEVDTAEDGAVAWQTLNADRYDLVITDQNMPKVTGVELIKKLRAARMALPVIIATGTLPKEEFARNPWAQPEATLLKPYTIAELLGTVKEVLRATNGARSPREILLAAGSSASAPPISQGEQISPPPNWQSQPTADRYAHQQDTLATGCVSRSSEVTSRAFEAAH